LNARTALRNQISLCGARQRGRKVKPRDNAVVGRHLHSFIHPPKTQVRSSAASLATAAIFSSMTNFLESWCSSGRFLDKVGPEIVSDLQHIRNIRSVSYWDTSIEAGLK